MLDIVKISEQLLTKLQQETDILMSDRLLSQQVLEARARELMSKRDDEMNRIEQWAAQQKALISEIFTALIAEVEADRQRNDSNLMRMKGASTFDKQLSEPVAARVRGKADAAAPRIVAQGASYMKAAQ